MPLTPVRLGESSTRVELSFRDSENDLTNIENQSVMGRVIHEVQTEMDVVSKHVSSYDMGKDVIKWQNLFGTREPRQIDTNISALEPAPQKIDKFGMTASKYGDEVWLTDYFKVKSDVISVEKEILKSMQMGFERLKSRNAFAAMVNPVRYRYTPRWKTAEAQTAVVELPDNRIGAVVAGASHANKVGSAIGSSVHLAIPDGMTFYRMMRQFTNNNVPASITPCAILTPNMLGMMMRSPEYYNRENIYSSIEALEKQPWFVWKGIKWIRVTPEVVPGAFYAGKKVDVSGVGASDIALKNLSDSGAGVLTATNHEVIPMWVPNNIVTTTDRRQDKLSVVKIPHYKNEPILFREYHCGGTRKQNILQFNVIVPLVA